MIPTDQFWLWPVASEKEVTHAVQDEFFYFNLVTFCEGDTVPLNALFAEFNVEKGTNSLK